MKKPRIHVISMGGTISMARSANGGGTPRLSAADLVAGIPGLGLRAEITCLQSASLPSASNGLGEIGRLIEDIEAAYASQAEGIVITHGTDTLEETAFALSICELPPLPVVLTGAMRASDKPGADGPANLFDACTVAADPRAKDLGPLLVFAGDVHAGSLVYKADANHLSPFSSQPFGPIGRVVEDALHLALIPRTIWPQKLRIGPLTPRIVHVAAGLRTEMNAVHGVNPDAVDGLVISALGAGHVAADVCDDLERMARRVPVVIASRTRTGTTLTQTYGFAGSEIDLRERGLIMGGFLSPARCSVLMHILLSWQISGDHFRSRFRDFAQAL